MIKRLRFQLVVVGGGGEPPLLRQETLFHDPDSFRFAQEIMFFKLTSWN